MWNNIHPEIGDVLKCSVCGKEFKAHDDTKYIINGGYTCTWKCFLDCCKEKEKNKKKKGCKDEK